MPPPPRSNPVRRPHAKSRTGCRVCKSRRVKCDETRPSCRRCITHGAQCDFLLEAEASTPRAYDEASTREALSIHQLTSPSTPPEIIQQSPSAWYSAQDIELMHHFTTSTCLTLASDPNVRNFWRVNVPQIGFAYPYVLKGILALSALHLSRLRPQQRDSLVKQAMVHHNASTSMVMPILSENVIGNDEFTPVFCYSMLTTTITFARPRTTDDFLLVSNGILPEWLLISRGVTHLIEAQGEHIFSISSMDALFHSGKDFTAAWLQHGDTEHEGLRELEANIRHDVIDSEQLTGLEEGIIALRRSFGLYAANGHDEEKRLRSVLVWVIMLPQSFITLLRSHCCEALCVLAYYCVLLKRMEHVWWVEGWAFHLIERIYSALDERHRLWIRWPLEEIGWAP